MGAQSVSSATECCAVPPIAMFAAPAGYDEEAALAAAIAASTLDVPEEAAGLAHDVERVRSMFSEGFAYVTSLDGEEHEIPLAECQRIKDLAARVRAKMKMTSGSVQLFLEDTPLKDNEFVKDTEVVDGVSLSAIASVDVPHSRFAPELSCARERGDRKKMNESFEASDRRVYDSHGADGRGMVETAVMQNTGIHTCKCRILEDSSLAIRMGMCSPHAMLGGGVSGLMKPPGVIKGSFALKPTGTLEGVLAPADDCDDYGSHVSLISGDPNGTRLMRAKPTYDGGRTVDPLMKPGDIVDMVLDSDTGVFTWVVNEVAVAQAHGIPSGYHFCVGRYSGQVAVELL